MSFSWKGFTQPIGMIHFSWMPTQTCNHPIHFSFSLPLSLLPASFWPLPTLPDLFWSCGSAWHGGCQPYTPVLLPCPPFTLHSCLKSFSSSSSFSLLITSSIPNRSGQSWSACVYSLFCFLPLHWSFNKYIFLVRLFGVSNLSRVHRSESCEDSSWEVAQGLLPP